MRWTKPYYGVQHLLDAPKPYQISLEDHGTFTDVAVMNMENHPWTSGPRKTFDTVKDAQQWAEQQCKRLANF